MAITKPTFSYFQLPDKHPLASLNLPFSKCKHCPRFTLCSAIFEEKEYLRNNFKELYPDVVKKLAEEAYASGLDEINSIKLEREYKNVINIVFNRNCVYEVEGTYNIIQNVSKDYDVTKGKNYLLLRELLVSYIYNIRFDADATDNTLFNEVQTERGTIRVCHPGLKNKVEFSKLMLEYIKQLEAFSKDTVQIKIEGEFTMKQMLDKIIDLDINNVKKIN